jgi:ribosomal protein S8
LSFSAANLQNDVPFALINAPDQEMKEFDNHLDIMSADSGFVEQMQVDDASSIEKLKMKLKFSENSNPAVEPVKCLFG